MNAQPTIIVSSGMHEGLPTDDLADLLLAYHLQTESEKGAPGDGVADLPDRYRAEVTDPRTAFRGQTVLVATIGSAPAGCVVLTASDGGRYELKRLWTSPAFRGRAVASRLVEAALAAAADGGASTVRLTVWEWRTGAIALYERLGFTRRASWDDRAGLVCMQWVAPRAG